MRSLGQFVGHIVRGAKADVGRPQTREELHREVDEQTREIDGRTVVVRRTTIEEIEVKDDDQNPTHRTSEN